MNYIKKVAIAIIFVIIAVSSSYTYEAYSSMCNINNKVIRLHVIANSDSITDQQLKYKVRNEIVEKFNKEFETIVEKESSESIIIEKLNEIRELAEEAIRRENYNYDIKVYYGNYNFPRKQYEDIVLPEGNYDAVRIEIGKAEGKNWWCVMFPPLCFVDFGTTEDSEPVFDVDTETYLAEILTEKEIEDIKLKRGSEDVKLKSKIYEVIQKGKLENAGIEKSETVYAYSIADE